MNAHSYGRGRCEAPAGPAGALEMHTHTRGLRGLSRSVPSGQGASVAHLSGLCRLWGITSRLGKAPLCQQWVEHHASQVELPRKNPPVDAGDVKRRRFDPRVGKITLEEELATHPSVPAWRTPWTEKPGGLQSTGSQNQTRLKRLGAHRLRKEIMSPTNTGTFTPRGRVSSNELLLVHPHH